MIRTFWTAAILLFLPTAAPAISEGEFDAPRPDNPVSPALRIEHGETRGTRDLRAGEPELRSIDGTGNNLADPEMGAASTQLVRYVDPDYADGISAMAGGDRPGPREVSNAVCAQAGSVPNPLGATDYLWQWGQFVDHDIDFTGGTDPPEPADIAVPPGDPFFDPAGSGDEVIFFNRSIYDPATGTVPGNARQQINEITAWIDASMVYGSDAERARALRTNDGTGRLKTSAGGLLPLNVDGLPNAGGTSEALFLAGDVRANEQVALLAMHTLFVREHNRLARRIAEQEPGLDGEAVYQKARRLVGAMVQAITYREYLPALLGRGALPPYDGYRPDVEAGITNLFSTASYRYGHSALSPMLLRLDSSGREIPAGHLGLREAFFAPERISEEGGIDPILRGLAAQPCQRIDPMLVDDVRNFLFGEPGAGGFDLASLNIQRGRDHGLPSYNEVRRALGMPPARRFEDITSRRRLREGLASVYEDVEQVDVWVGGLAEDPMPGAHVGPLVHRVLALQFQALRDGDRFWYQRDLSQPEIEMVERSRLSDIIRRNTAIAGEIPDDVFRMPGDDTERRPPTSPR